MKLDAMYGYLTEEQKTRLWKLMEMMANASRNDWVCYCPEKCMIHAKMKAS